MLRGHHLYVDFSNICSLQHHRSLLSLALFTDVTFYSQAALARCAAKRAPAVILRLDSPVPRG